MGYSGVEFDVSVWAKTKVEAIKLAKKLAMPKSIRGLLCSYCNRFILGAVGRHPVKHFRDNPELFIRAAQYLKQFKPAGDRNEISSNQSSILADYSNSSITNAGRST